MAVLRSGPFHAPGPAAPAPVGRPVAGLAAACRRTVRIFTQPLPDDVIECEVSVVVLFRASQALNFLTGGRDEMTFSARCHVLGRRARSPLARLAWRGTEGVIDAFCGIFRGECEHCATAWVNFRRRGRRG